MTLMSLAAAAALVTAVVVATIVARRLADRTGLGIGHPAVVWLGLHGILFGIGALVLALVLGRASAAAYLAGALGAFAIGAHLSDRLATRRRTSAGTTAGTYEVPGAASGARHWLVAILAISAVAIVVPTLISTGIPFLVGDITSSRVELSGLLVQPLRVFLPAAACVGVLEARRRGRRSRWAAAGGVTLVAAFELALASRYLLAELAGSIALAWVLSGGRLPGRVIAGLAGLGLVLFGGIQLLRAYDQAQGRELAFVVERTVNRVVLIQPRTLDALMAVIPDEEPFFAGATWVRRLIPQVDRDIPNLGYWIYPRVVGQPGTVPVAGYAAPGLIGEAWANLGWAGLALFAGLGVAVERLGVIASRRRSAIPDLAASALLILFVGRTHALGLNGLLVVIALILVWRLSAGPAGGLGRDLGQALRWDHG